MTKQMQTIKTLHTFEMFKEWEMNKLQLVYYLFTFLRCARGQLIYQVDDTPEYIYIVMDGVFEIFAKNLLSKQQIRGKNRQSQTISQEPADAMLGNHILVEL